MRTTIEWYITFLLILTILTGGCATQLPVAASCPPPDPLPKAVMEIQSASTKQSLLVEFEAAWNALLDDLRASFEAARKTAPSPKSVQPGL